MQHQAMPRWHMALFWWVGAPPLAAFLALRGHYGVAAVFAGFFVFGVVLLAAFRDEARALLCEWRLVAKMWLAMVLMLGGVLVFELLSPGSTWSFLLVLASMYPFIRWGVALSHNLQARSAPNSSLKRTDQSLRD